MLAGRGIHTSDTLQIISRRSYLEGVKILLSNGDWHSSLDRSPPRQLSPQLKKEKNIFNTSIIWNIWCLSKGTKINFPEAENTKIVGVLPVQLLWYIWQLDTIFWGVLKRALFDGHPFIHIKLLPKLFTHGGKLLCCSSPLVLSGRRCLAQVYLDVGLFLFSGKLHCLTKLVPSSYSWPGQFCYTCTSKWGQSLLDFSGSKY